jgi:hypothetical protein
MKNIKNKDPFLPVFKETPKKINIVNNIKNEKNIEEIMEKNIGEMEIFDMRYESDMKKDFTENNKLPSKITSVYKLDYNILYIDEIIRKKLEQEKYKKCKKLKKKLDFLSNKPSVNHIEHIKNQKKIEKIKNEIELITSGERIKKYNKKVNNIISEYKNLKTKIHTVFFENDLEPENYQNLDNEKIRRLFLIDKFLDIASNYINIDIVRLPEKPNSICLGCGKNISNVIISDYGSKRCPFCNTEHEIVISVGINKDNSRLNNNNNEEESIDNFLRAFDRKQGIQVERPDESLYQELDNFFISNGRPTGEEIRKLPLNSRGRRGDTNHKMLWNALSQIGRSQYYEDDEIIGHIYWGWKLNDYSHLKERIIDKYNKTQQVFYQIPLEERERNSSLGTQYRLWRHLQLEGVECYQNEFKIAENSESLRLHNKIWRLMVEGANDPNIYYID